MRICKIIFKALLFIGIITIMSVAMPVPANAEGTDDAGITVPGAIYVSSGGWYEIGGEMHYFHAAGEMAADEWLLWDGNWYYFKPNAVMAAGEIMFIDGTSYAFDHKGRCYTDDDEKIWWFFKSKNLNDYAVAGIIGNLYAESMLKPQNLQDACEKQLGFTDETYTIAVDGGAYKRFAEDSAGYGLAQWTGTSRKKKLLEFARNMGTSAGDIDMQLAFIWEELCGPYSSTLGVLKKAKSVREASDVFLTRYESPADQSDAVKAFRAQTGKMYFEKFRDISKARECE